MIGNAFLSRMILGLLLTEALELSGARIFFRFDKGSLFACTLINGITNPAAAAIHFVCRSLWGLPSLALQGCIEGCVILAEWLFYRGERTIARPFLCSLLLNAFSWSVGLLVQRLT